MEEVFEKLFRKNAQLWKKGENVIISQRPKYWIDFVKKNSWTTLVFGLGLGFNTLKKNSNLLFLLIQ